MTWKSLPPKQELTNIVKKSKDVHFNYILRNRAFAGDLTKSEAKDLAEEYSSLDKRYQDLLLAYTTLLLDNSRLANENEFMLKLLNKAESE